MARALMPIEGWEADDAGRDRTQSLTGGPPHRQVCLEATTPQRCMSRWESGELVEPPEMVGREKDLKTTLRRHVGGARRTPKSGPVK